LNQSPAFVYDPPKGLTVGGTDYLKAAGINIDTTTPLASITGLNQSPGFMYDPLKPFTVGGADYLKAAGINIDTTTPLAPITGLNQSPFVYDPLKPFTVGGTDYLNTLGRNIDIMTRPTNPPTLSSPFDWNAITFRVAGSLQWLLGQPAPHTPLNELFEIRFFYLDSTRNLKEQIVLATYDATNGKVRDAKVVSLPAPDNLDSSQPILSGSPELFFELIHPTRPEFDDLRSNPALKPFFSPRPRAEVTPNEAMAFAKALIEATSERGPSLNPDIHVSKSCDCAILTPAAGFKWVSDEDYPPPVMRPAQEPTRKRRTR
ncbi:MAG: hypothetical protein ACREDR_46665, partial [Blastocatellia bacterium]